ncbi:hypothetical protein [Lactobacillus sp. ESL0677]|uniref:hypothetical protein n=1 Tax=Lactobacillus sp. ESL0677 TaxID=2983208 RepID=UPI0023F8897F|nr:hypothetical protein [Lactobacillus sp. ESL0677]WEV37743.1 hypothetical protein OZX76_04100 [Lactobacillus sp. ESL0677]
MLTYNGKQYDHFCYGGQTWLSANYFPKKFRFGKNPGKECQTYTVNDNGILEANNSVEWAVCDRSGFPVMEAWVDNIITKNGEDYALVKVATQKIGSWISVESYIKISDFGGATPL